MKQSHRHSLQQVLRGERLRRGWTQLELAEAVPFRLGGSNCTHVLTTRFPALARAFAAESVITLQELDQSESVALLKHLAPEAFNDSHAALSALLHLVGGLPLALTLVGRYLHIQGCNGQPRRVQRVIERLSQNVEERLRLAEPQVPWEHATTWQVGAALSLQATLEISENYLPQAAREVLYALSIFPFRVSRSHDIVSNADRWKPGSIRLRWSNATLGHIHFSPLIVVRALRVNGTNQGSCLLQQRVHTLHPSNIAQRISWRSTAIPVGGDRNVSGFLRSCIAFPPSSSLVSSNAW